MFNTSIPLSRAKAAKAAREAKADKAYYKNYYNDDCVSLSDEDSDDKNDKDYKPDDKEDYDSNESSECSESLDHIDFSVYKNHRKVWTKEDDKYLLKLFLLEYSYSDISSHLERTEDAIKARIVKTILCKKYTKKTLNDNIYTLCKTFDIKKIDMVRYITYVIPSFELKQTVKSRINFI
jgi:hypothetical protein